MKDQIIILMGTVVMVMAAPQFGSDEDDSRSEEYDPVSYSFAYGVNDPIEGVEKEHKETFDASGFTEGEYRWLQPNGFYRVTKYTVNGPEGYQAVVSEEPGDSIENYYTNTLSGIYFSQGVPVISTGNQQQSFGDFQQPGNQGFINSQDQGISSILNFQNQGPTIQDSRLTSFSSGPQLFQNQGFGSSFGSQNQGTNIVGETIDGGIIDGGVINNGVISSQFSSSPNNFNNLGSNSNSFSIPELSGGNPNRNVAVVLAGDDRFRG